MNPNTIQLAISTCPNDTFAFHALMHRLVDMQGLEFDVQLLDISQLNEGLFSGKFDVAKASFHAAVLLADQTVVLPCGSALGFGVGPLLLAAIPDTQPGDFDSVTYCPGRHTTATMLFQMFYRAAPVQHEVFSDIMPALLAGKADFGVCIHEGRFTWQEQGLYLVEDLGTRWETETDQPLPLGGILARNHLTKERRRRVINVVRDSIRWGLQNRKQTLPTMRKYAQEFSDDVLFQHVDLYVNDWTIELGDTGRLALQELSRRAMPEKTERLTIVDT